MKKYLIWIPVIGFFIIGYYQLIKCEDMVSFDRPIQFFTSVIYQGIAIAYLLTKFILY